MGKLGGYIVTVPDGVLIEELNENQLRKEYGEYLGKRFVPCNSTDSLNVFKIDVENRRIFVGSNRFELGGESRVHSKILTVKEYVVRCLGWERDWSVSFFRSKEFAGYKTDKELNYYVQNGTWAENYIAEFDAEKSLLTHFPAIPDSIRHERIILQF